MKDEDKTKEQLIEELRVSNGRFLKAQRIGKTGFMELDVKTGNMYWSDEVYNLYGVDINVEATIDLTTSLIHPDDAERVHKSLALAIKGGQPHELDHRMVRQIDDDTVWVHAQTEIVCGANGEPEFILGSIVDITERKQSESNLFKTAVSKKYLDNIITSMADSLIVVNPNATISSVNRATLELLGYEELEVIGKPIEMIFDEGQGVFDGVGITSFIKNESIKNSEEHYLAKDGRKIPVQFSASVMQDVEGNIEGIVCVASDRTERKQAEQEIILNKLILDNLSEGVAMTRLSDGIIIYTNPRFEKIFGYEPLEMLGIPISEINAPTEKAPEDIHAEINLSIEKKGHWFGEVYCTKKDGSYFWTEAKLSIFNHSTHGAVAIGFQQDISERKLIEEKLRQSQKMEAIGTLSGGIAHEFNNILGGMMGYSELLMEKLPKNSEERNYIERVYSSGERASDLVKQILTFGRKDSSKQSMQRMSLVIQDALKMIRVTLPATIEVRADIDPDCRPVMINTTQIHQIIINICNNAAHSMEEKGGILSISLKNTQKYSNQSLPSVDKENYLLLTISDTGSGISPDVKERIFEPFFTTKDVGKGTGLGLSVVHGIVEQHQGKILVESEIGKGSTFSVFFPIAVGEVQDIEIQGSHSLEGAGHILVVDDEPNLVDFYNIGLQKNGFSTTVYHNSLQALEAFRKSPYGFDVVFTDQTMPGLTGIELSKELLSIRADIPIILATGYSQTISKEGALSQGIKAYLQKPIKLKELIPTIQRFNIKAKI
ncbi:MAG: PAS domain S-box protein [Bermanella sp.]